MRCVVLTPARNERDFLPGLAESLAAQTVRPALWLILENGSSDDTCEVARQLEDDYDFARLLRIPTPRQPPQRGAPVVRALHAGLDKLSPEYELILKVDADVTLAPEYIERLIEEFERDERLGIASGTCFEEEGEGQWFQRHMTGHMVWCAARAYRRECLNGILPFPESFGWDGIDIAKARLLGWHTRLSGDFSFSHHRTEGARDGAPGGSWANAGRGSHYLSYRPSYVLFRALNGLRNDFRAGLMIWGYFMSLVAGNPRYEGRDVVELIRHEQRWRFLFKRFRESQGHR